jgi:hypothetical protein
MENEMTIALGLLKFFLGPIGRYVAMVLAALIFYGAWDLHIRHKEDLRIEQQQKIERQHNVNKGTAARNRATQRFDRGRLRDDGFARD